MNNFHKTLQWLANRSLSQVLIIGVVLAAAFVLWGPYQQQFLTFLPYLILLLCPLMHIFMHRGHGKHGGHKQLDEESH